MRREVKTFYDDLELDHEDLDSKINKFANESNMIPISVSLTFVRPTFLVAAVIFEEVNMI